MFTDTHAHLCWPDFAAELPAVIERARAAGVTRIVTIATSAENARASLDIAACHDSVYAAVGFHPADIPLPAAAAVRKLPLSEKVVAIGETGLDYHREAKTDTGLRQQQRQLFQAHLDLARQRRLPVVIHHRDAEADMRAMLRANVPDWRPWGVMHCFTGSEDFARECLDLGLFVSFAGILTFKNGGPLRAVAQALPLEQILLETDAPYLAPAPHRGKCNEPAFLPFIAAVIAELKSLPVAEVARITSANAAQLFGFDAVP